MTHRSNATTRALRHLSTLGSIALLLCTLIAGSAAYGQVLYGTITGTVTDTTQAAIADATVTVTNQANGLVRTAQTNGSGDYNILNLEPGPYTVSIKGSGAFGTFTQKNVALSANRQVRVDATLQPASVTAEVTVSTAPPLLQTDSAEVNHEISSTQIAELPITSSQGRNFQALYTLLPGASPPYEQNSTASNPARGMSTNVNGIASVSNTTRIDGAVNTYGWLPYIIAYIPPADAIQSVNVVTNSFNAEQGIAGGASINVTIKSGSSQFHGSAWEYNQLFNTNARAYTQTSASFPRVPKNIFNQFGASIGGPVYIPKLLTNKNKLFFFFDFERTTRRQLITGLQTVPDAAMLTGNFNEVASGLTASNTILYDPQPGGVPATGPNQVNGYLLPGFRPTFASEYPATGNAIPASRQSAAAQKMLALLAPISATVGTPSSSLLANQLVNDYNGSGTLAYNRNVFDAKITYNPTDRTTFFGRYSWDPFTVTDPQELGAAGGGTFDGGQPGAAAGRIQNVGLGMSHVITPNLVIDTDFGYSRQRTGAQSTIDLAVGDFGLSVLGIPGTNGPGINYVGQPIFAMSGGSSFSSLGNSNTANPFLFRDNQYTGDVNVSWTIGKHSTKYGGEYYHFALNHFQPSAGSGVNNPRGGFVFQGGMTSNSTSGFTNYNSLADMLLGIPNSGAAPAVAKTSQLSNPNAVRWSAFAFYAQDQWTITPKLTLNYGVRYEYYPPPTRDHSGIFVFDPSQPIATNVELGGINGNPNSAGMDVGWGMIEPRLGIAYRVNDRMVIRTGAGLTEDPDNFRFFRDTYPMDNIQNYNSPATGQIATSTGGTTGAPLPLTVGIPAAVFPNLSTGFVSKPVTTSTTTAPKNFRRGYIESWNLFLQQDLGARFIANIGYVGTHEVRQISSIDINPAPLPSGTTVCMANGQYNPSSPYYTSAGAASNNCSFNANEVWNVFHCNGTTGATCYDTAAPGNEAPTFSAEYNALQAQLTRTAGRVAQFGIVYTWSHAIDFADNSTYNGPSFSYPAYYGLNRATAGYDHPSNFQFWWIYHLPFGKGQALATHGIASAIFGGFQLNGQLSHYSGEPFSVTASNTVNAPGNTLYASLVKPYHQIGGHNRTPGNSAVSNGQPYFDPTAFANPVEPTYTSTQTPSQIVAPVFGNTHRNEFRGPGQTLINASIFRGFHIWRESEFQIRVEAFNLLNHATISTCGFPQGSTGNVCSVSVSSSTLGYITSFGNTRSLQFSGRFSF
jgi:Carboxypeptidase regulatory-like domain